MKNKKTIVLMGALGLIACLCPKTNAVKFYDTVGTRYEGAVERLGELGIINGVSDKAFEANRTITRAEFAKMIVEATLTQDEINALIIDDANCTFTDISKDKWYYQYVVVATNYGYINGYEDNTFRPDDEVTYEQVAKMLMKALGHGYLVETDPRGWSAEYMDKMYSLNIADGTTKFAKTDSATRGNIAIMIWNTLTSNVWEKILLNDVDGFTYIDSGRSLFNKKIDGYVFKKNFKINGFREIDDNLYLKIDDTYYKLYDQDASILFSMLGGKAEGLFKYMRYPNDEYTYEIVGLSTDLGSQLYSGTLNELQNEGFELKIPTTKIGTNEDYAYLLKAEEEENDRAITMDADATRFYIQKIEIKTEKGEPEKDDKETIEKIEASNHAYEYIDQYVSVTKTIKLNDEYEIKDGAVLFENNKRVKWDTVKEGDIITEIKKNEYYFVSHKEVEATVNEYAMKADGIKFSTTQGEVIAYYNADCLEYYAKDGETKYLYSLGNDGLSALEGLKVKFFLDFTGKAVRVEILEETEEEKTNTGMKEMNLAYYITFNATEEDKNNTITLILNGKEKTYRTTLKGVNAEYGDLVYFEMDSRNIVTTVKLATNGTKIDEKQKMSKMDYDDLIELIENEEVTTKVPLYITTYHYDFGEYDKITDFEVKKTDVSILSDLNGEKLELYVVADARENIKLIIVMNYSEKKDVFYGKIEKIYTEDANIKAEISIFGYKKMTYTVSGLLNCEENDMVSFKILGKDSIKILEKYNVAAMGYYKDIIIEEVVGSRITAENAEIDLKQGKIVTEAEEYLLSHFDIILLTLKEDTEGNLFIYKGYGVEPKDIKLQKNDRIAINEIEDTIIIYRGY